MTRAFLQWAYAHDACLVEDDFDCEHRFGVGTSPSLWSLDRHGRVIHVSSFARSMFPALQLGYMLVPRTLRERFLAVKWLADRGSTSMQQHVLAVCISSGQYLRDLRRIAHRLAPRHRALHAAYHAVVVVFLITCAAAVISPMVSFFTRSPVMIAATSGDDSSPRMICRMSESISS